MRILFTRHAEKRIKSRGVLKQEIIDAIKYPDKTIKKHGCYYYQKNLGRGKIEIVCEKKAKNIKIITVYWE